MSLRRHMLVTLAVSLSVLWLVMAAWLLVELNQRVRHTLDQRLMASANMVAGLVGQVPPSVWQKTVTPALATPPDPGVACQIRSLRGEVLLQTRGDLNPLLDHAATGFSNHVRHGHQWRVYTIVRNGLAITVADRIRDRDQLELGIVVAAALPFIVALVGSLFAGWWSIRRGLKPLERLRDELARRDPESLAPVAVPRAPTELAPVLATLNTLLVRTDQAMQREQRFTGNAAHELRTPLTAIKTHVQLARRAQGSRADEALAGAELGIARMQRTLEQLLLLARVEGGESWPDETVSSAAEIVRLVSADLRLPDAFLAGAVAEQVRVAAPRELAVAALRNLLDNALTHSGAPDSVRLHVETRAQWVSFAVVDAGGATSVPSLQRFERGTASRGSGLGLTVVTAIATRFGGRFEVKQREPLGLCARLTLPRPDGATV